MKKVLLVVALFSALGFSRISAQIVNNSFENWKMDTFYLPAASIGTLPADTTVFPNPIGWTSSNYLTSLDSLGGHILVTQTMTAYGDHSAIQLKSDSISVKAVYPTFSKIVIPGFALNGHFPLTAASLVSGGGSITPVSIKGAGQPCTSRLKSLNGYYSYKPVYSSSTGSYDTCVVWATLRKGPLAVANAIFKSTDSTGGYLPFSVNFNYISCEVPDTLVILISSSSLHLLTFITIPAGSTLLLDSLTTDTLPANYIFAPFARNDISTGYTARPDTINVLANDTDCTGDPLNVSVVSGPHNGTAVVVGNKIYYTSNAGFVGYDTLVYKDVNATTGDTADATVIIAVLTPPAGINEVNEIPIQLYPIPASNELTIQFDNPGKTIARVYDLIGNLVISANLTNNENLLNIGKLSNGLYSVLILSAENAVVGRSKFVVTK